MKKLIQHIPGWAKSKYTLAGSAFLLWMLFFDEQDLITTHFKQTSELNQIVESRKYYEQEIEHTRNQLENMRSHPDVLEKYAREKYRMKKENEDIFIIPLEQ